MSAPWIGIARQAVLRRGRLAALAVCLAWGAGAARAQLSPAEYGAQIGLKQIQADAAYGRTDSSGNALDGRGVTVAVLDTGIDPSHPEFCGSRFLAGKDFVDSTATTRSDLDGHGSHVTGILAANADGVGMQGVAHGCTILPVRILDEKGVLQDEATARNGIDHAVASNALILNCSWGPADQVTEYTKSGVERDLPVMLASFRNAVSHGRVVVFSAGNDSFANPCLFAGLPHLFPELKPLWVNVVGVNPAGTLASYSDAAGVAAPWTIAAPGGGDTDKGEGPGILSVLSNQSNPSPSFLDSYVRECGTSMAAPHVSGALAILAQAFPSLTARQLVELMLVTATDLGDAGIDAVYGHGLLDLDRATLGPVIQAGQPLVVDTGSYAFDLSLALSGAGGLVKRGAGTLTMEGASTYTGMTSVEGGTLVVSGSLAAPVSVGLGGTLGGAGSTGTIQNEGVVQPGSPAGVLTVTGDFDNGPDGTLGIRVVDAGSYGRLAVGGRVTLNGGTLKVTMPGTLPHGATTRLTVLTSAPDLLAGRFTTLDVPLVLSGSTLEYDSSAVVLAAFASYRTGATGDNQLAMAANLDAVANTGGLPGLTGALDALATRTQMSDALDQLSPELYDAHRAIVLADAQAFAEAFERRFAVGEDGELSFACPSDRRGGRDQSSWLGLAGYGSVASASTDRDGQVTTRTGFTSRSAGVRSGYLWHVDEHLSAGLVGAVAGEKGTIDRAGGTVSATQLDVGPYATYESDGLFANALFWYGRHAFDTHRQVAFAGFPAVDLTGSPTVNAFCGRLGGGVMWRLGRWMVGPALALDGLSMSMGTFTETGGAGALTVLKRDVSSLRSVAGVNLAVEVALDSGTIVPELRLRWAHEFLDSDRAVRAAFDGGGAGSFEVQSASPGKDSALVGAGLTCRLSRIAEGSMRYDGDIGRAGLAVHSLTLGARLTF